MLFTIPMGTCCTLDPANMVRALNPTKQLATATRWRPPVELRAGTSGVGRNKTADYSDESHGAPGGPAARVTQRDERWFTMCTRFRGFCIIPVAPLALAMMFPAGPVSAQTAASHDAAVSGSGDRIKASSERHGMTWQASLPGVVQHSPSSIPGRDIVQVVTEIPAGIESGWHVHPGEEVGYIIAGEVEMMVQGRATVVLHAGDGFLIPPRIPHNARDLGPETGRMLSTYIVETGQPLATFVDSHVER
jgi:quercetin dioxygenase-like cupin family protein